MNGILNIYKPTGITSFDVVRMVRKISNVKKVGHAGTLDPEASGVLPVCIGKATKAIDYIMGDFKIYETELKLGVITDTYDREGVILKESEVNASEDEIIQAINSFAGEINQVPPMYSALKVNGKKLYELAREGITVDRKLRNITIYEQKILDIEENKRILFLTKCSRGTYIRTLCDDIGEELGTYGYMSYLLRVGVGSFKIENAYSIEYIKSLNLEELSKIIVPMDDALDHFDEIIIQEELYSKIINGIVLPFEMSENYKTDTPYKVYCKDTFMGIGKIINKDMEFYLKMDKVLII